MNGTGESFVTGFIFTYVQNIFLWPYWRGAIVPSAPIDPSLTGFQSEQVIYMLTTSGCQVDFASSTLCGSLRKTSFHTYVLPIDEQKRSAKSFIASGTSPLKLIAKTLRYQDASFPT